MKHAFILVAVFLLGLGLLSCNVVTNPAGEVNNLVKNGSFEQNSHASLKYWMGIDSSKVKFVQDAPDDGGNWCASLPATQYEPSALHLAQEITLSPHRYVLLFSFWAKRQSVNGRASLFIKNSDGQLLESKGKSVTDSVWTHYSLIDTVQIQSGQKLFVNLFGGGTEVVGGHTCFDLISLTVKQKN